jgi:hypothetical protein
MSKTIKLGDLCEIKTNFPEADFWLSVHTGTPTRSYAPGLVGIKVTATEQLIPNFLFYAMEYLEMKGLWRAGGPTVEAVRNVEFTLQEKSNER